MRNCSPKRLSTTQVPDYFHATIDGRPATDVITDEAWLQGEFISTVQKRGAAIIAARGLSSAAGLAFGINGDSKRGR